MGVWGCGWGCEGVGVWVGVEGEGGWGCEGEGGWVGVGCGWGLGLRWGCEGVGVCMCG